MCCDALTYFSGSFFRMLILINAAPLLSVELQLFITLMSSIEIIGHRKS